MSKLSTHVLDTSLGRPAADLTVHLDRLDEAGEVLRLATHATSADGRIPDLLSGGALSIATYRLTFETGPYFARSSRATLYPRVEIVFAVSAPSEHHHVPLLLSPFGYSTYRGS